MAYIDSNAKSWGEALFMLAEEDLCTESVREDLLTVTQAIHEDPDYVKLLDTPALSRDERVGLVSEAFGSLNSDLVNLIKILAEKRMAYLIPKINDAFGAYYDASRGIERVDAISAVPLSDAQLERLVSRLEALTEKKIIIKNTVDPSILGGMKLRYMGKQIDGSLKTKLDGFEQSLKDLVI